jgi:hypothetical protein
MLPVPITMTPPLRPYRKAVFVTDAEAACIAPAKAKQATTRSKSRDESPAPLMH